jgi:hypothetical protein
LHASMPKSGALPSPTGATFSEQNTMVKSTFRVAAAYSHNNQRWNLTQMRYAVCVCDIETTDLG